MNCRQFRRNLSRYLDERLTDAETRQLEAHQAHCEGCADQLRQARQAQSLLRAQPAVELPRDLTAQVMAGVFESGVDRRRPELFHLSVLRVGASLAALLALLLLAMQLWYRPEVQPAPTVEVSSRDTTLVEEPAEETVEFFLLPGGAR